MSNWARVRGRDNENGELRYGFDLLPSWRFPRSCDFSATEFVVIPGGRLNKAAIWAKRSLRRRPSADRHLIIVSDHIWTVDWIRLLNMDRRNYLMDRTALTASVRVENGP